MTKIMDQFGTIGHYTQRRFSNDNNAKSRSDFSTLTLGKVRKTRKKDQLPHHHPLHPLVNSKTLPLQHSQPPPSPQRQKKTTQQQWQHQQDMIAQRQRLLQQQQQQQQQNQQKKDRLQKYFPHQRFHPQNTPTLARATSHSILTDAMKNKIDDDDANSWSSDSIINDDMAVGYAKDRRNFKRSGSEWDLSKCLTNMAECQHKSSTLPNFQRNKFKSESNLRDHKFDQEPPALPPRNNPFKNSHVRKVEIQKQKSGEFGIAIDCTKIKTHIVGVVSTSVQNFPFVRAVDPRGPTARTSIKRGDYILQVNDVTTEGINFSILEAMIKSTKQRLRLVVASLPPANHNPSSTPQFKVKNKMTFDKTPPPPNRTPLLRSKFNAPDRVTSRQSNNRIYDVIDDIFSSESSVQTVVPSTPKNYEYIDCETETAGRSKINSNEIVEVIIGQKPKQVRNKRSTSENSSGFGSEENSPENSSGSSLGIPSREDKNRITEQPIISHSTTMESGTIYANKDEAPPPLPPKTFNLPKTPPTTSCVYQNEEAKYSKPIKSPTGIRPSNPKVNIVSLSINVSKKPQQFDQPPTLKPKFKINDDENDKIFLDEFTNTGMRVIFPKTGQTRRAISYDNPEVQREIIGQSSKVNELNKIRTFKSSTEMEADDPFFLAPPEDFADPGNKMSSIRYPFSTIITNKNCPKMSNFNYALQKSNPPPAQKSIISIISSNNTVTEKANHSDLSLWTREEVETWLKSIGLEGSVVKSFAARGIDGGTLSTLKRSDLIALGLKGLEERRDFERALVRVRLRNL